MALTLALTSSNTSTTQLTLTDSTGDYASDNTGGWGAPNTNLTAVQYAYLIVEDSAGSTYEVDIINDLSIDFSTVASDELIYNVTHDLLGGTAGTILEDGIYNILYQISTRAITDPADFDATANPTTDFELEINVMTYYVVQGSVFERIAEIPTYYQCADCDNLYVKETTTLFMLLQSLIAASTYSTTTKFSLILDLIEDILSFDSDLDEDCGC